MQEAYKKVPAQQGAVLSAPQHKQHGSRVLAGPLHAHCGMATLMELGHCYRSAKLLTGGCRYGLTSLLTLTQDSSIHPQTCKF